MSASSLPEPSLSLERVLECLAAIALCIRQSRSLDYILNATVMEVRELLQTDRVLIYRFDPDWSGVVVAESVSSGWSSILDRLIHDPCFEMTWVEPYRQGRVSTITDIYTNNIQPCYVEFLTQFQVRANLVVPILQNTPDSSIPNRLWGLLIAHHCCAPRQWQPLEVKLLQQLVVYAGIAIQQIELDRQAQTAIAERQAAEAKLQASEQFLRSIYEGTANSIFAIDVLPSGEFRFAGSNPTYERVTGLQSEDIRGKSPEQVLSAAAAAAVSNHYARCVEARMTISYEEYLPSNGKELWWLTTLTPLFDAQSQVYRLIGTSIDITDRKLAMEEQQKFVALVENCSDFIGMATMEGKPFFINKAGRKLVGFDSPEEMLTTDIFDYHTEESKERFREIAVPSFMTTDYWEGEGQFRHFKTNRPIDVYIHVFLVRSSDSGEPLCIATVTHDITERKQAEEELRRQQEFLRNVIDTDPNLICVKDWDGRFRLANQALADIYGTTIEELIGKRDADFSPTPAEVEQYVRDDRQVMSSLQPKFIPEEILTSATGEVHYLQTIKKPLLSSEGQVSCVLAVATDITLRKRAERERDREAAERHRLLQEIERHNQTLEAKVQERTAQLSIANEQLQQEMVERKQTEEALRESEEKFRQMAESIQSVFWMVDVDRTQIIYISPGYEQIWGRPRAELYASPTSWMNAIYPEDRDLVIAKLVKQLQGEHEAEYRIIRPDGEIRWIRDRAFVVQNEAGGVYRIVGVAEDISDRKRTEVALRESQEQLQAILDNSPAIVYLTDVENRYMLINRNYEQLFGLTAEQIAGKSLYEIWSPEIADAFVANNRKVLEGGTPIQVEEVAPQDDGIHAYISIKFPLHDVDGNPYAVCTISTDITERKQTEDKIKASLLEKETLLKEIHHRVKNNLQIISSLLRLQSRQIGDRLTLELFKESQDRIQAMALIHEQLYQSSNLAQINFQGYISTLVGNLCRSYEVHRQSITFELDIKQVSVAIDRAIPFGLIINELVSNSLKYAFPDNRSGEIYISLQENDKGQFILIVRDNGVGLPENLDFRNARSLGLQLVCRLTKQLEGNIELSRSQGTEFKIKLINPKGEEGR